MEAIDYLQLSTLYRKLIHGPYSEFSRVYAARLSEEGFTRQCTWRSLSLFRDLMDWHVGGGYLPTHFDEASLVRFLDHRSQHWRINAGTAQLYSSCKYHLVWITKYRVPVFGGDVGQRARELLREIARAHEMTICAGAINRDHVHMLIGIPPHLSVSRAVPFLKGKSSHKLLEEYQSLRKRY